MFYRPRGDIQDGAFTAFLWIWWQLGGGGWSMPLQPPQVCQWRFIRINVDFRNSVIKKELIRRWIRLCVNLTHNCFEKSPILSMTPAHWGKFHCEEEASNYTSDISLGLTLPGCRVTPDDKSQQVGEADREQAREELELEWRVEGRAKWGSWGRSSLVSPPLWLTTSLVWWSRWGEAEWSSDGFGNWNATLLDQSDG